MTARSPCGRDSFHVSLSFIVFPNNGRLSRALENPPDERDEFRANCARIELSFFEFPAVTTLILHISDAPLKLDILCRLREQEDVTAAFYCRSKISIYLLREILANFSSRYTVDPVPIERSTTPSNEARPTPRRANIVNLRRHVC